MKTNKEKLFETMSKIDSTFKPKLNETLGTGDRPMDYAWHIRSKIQEIDELVMKLGGVIQNQEDETLRDNWRARYNKLIQFSDKLHALRDDFETISRENYWV